MEFWDFKHSTKKDFAAQVLADLDAHWQIAQYDWYTRRTTEEFKEFVVEAEYWLEDHGLGRSGVIGRVLNAPGYTKWGQQVNVRKYHYLPQYAHDALKNWTPGDDPATVVPADTAAPERLEETR